MKFKNDVGAIYSENLETFLRAPKKLKKVGKSLNLTLNETPVLSLLLSYQHGTLPPNDLEVSSSPICISTDGADFKCFFSSTLIQANLVFLQQKKLLFFHHLCQLQLPLLSGKS
ncbi:hypothetical protein CDAR_292811 [Caerostris darwini]|uniref:Uncharacterized protein n=1 Tax=Caerostris darwini TaxID=1538125 RepID=A0AAV4RIT3_9ARAC|nr:hypothetical protein CDAR_292811 [Caerostris darwini]